MSEHNLPRLFTPDLLQRYMNSNDDISIPVLKTIIKKQQEIIDKQGTLISKHDSEIEVLKTSLQEVRLILNGRQFMNRSVSFEYIEEPTESNY